MLEQRRGLVMTLFQQCDNFFPTNEQLENFQRKHSDVFPSKGTLILKVREVRQKLRQTASQALPSSPATVTASKDHRGFVDLCRFDNFGHSERSVRSQVPLLRLHIWDGQELSFHIEEIASDQFLSTLTVPVLVDVVSVLSRGEQAMSGAGAARRLADRPLRSGGGRSAIHEGQQDRPRLPRSAAPRRPGPAPSAGSPSAPGALAAGQHIGNGVLDQGAEHEHQADAADLTSLAAATLQRLDSPHRFARPHAQGVLKPRLQGETRLIDLLAQRPGALSGHAEHREQPQADPGRHGAYVDPEGYPAEDDDQEAG
uniref:C2 tensin-type domain-containing protein n=1 Tax=Macrostomum lignano TaxID=282301 RepID=A0A1I8IWM2_9PLAT